MAVDVGHTLAACGAISARGRCEYEFNAVLAGLLAQELRARRIAVREINFDGLIDSLAARPQHAAGADFFISIHHDSVHPEWLSDWDWDGSSRTYSDVHRGFSLFVSRASPDLAGSLRCASVIGALLRRAGFSPTRHYAEAAAGPSRPVADLDNAVHFHDRLVVLYQTTLPAVLFEAGVIKHREEELALRDPARQIRMADAIASGIAACLQVNRATAGDEDPSQTRR